MRWPPFSGRELMVSVRGEEGEGDREQGRGARGEARAKKAKKEWVSLCLSLLSLSLFSLLTVEKVVVRLVLGPVLVVQDLKRGREREKGGSERRQEGGVRGRGGAGGGGRGGRPSLLSPLSRRPPLAVPLSSLSSLLPHLHPLPVFDGQVRRQRDAALNSQDDRVLALVQEQAVRGAHRGRQRLARRVVDDGGHLHVRLGLFDEVGALGGGEEAVQGEDAGVPGDDRLVAAPGDLGV